MRKQIRIWPAQQNIDDTVAEHEDAIESFVEIPE